MNVEGFCVDCKADGPATDNRRCVACGAILIPPSWSRAGVPFPWPPRPEGWSWSPPRPLDVAVAMVQVVCGQCGAPFTTPKRGGGTPRYCTSICQRRAKAARSDARKVATT